MNELISFLRESSCPDVRATFESLRNDLAETLADLAADILLHQERCEETLDELPDEAFDDPALDERARSIEAPFWNLLVEDFQRLAVWMPRQRIARHGEADAVRVFRDRLVAALRPALVELQRYEVLKNGTAILSDDYWDAESLYDLSLRYEGFTLALHRALQSRMRHDSEDLRRLAEAHGAELQTG